MILHLLFSLHISLLRYRTPGFVYTPKSVVCIAGIGGCSIVGPYVTVPQTPICMFVDPLI